MTSKDVTNVEYSRMLKRNGIPQESQAYWQGMMPSLSSIQGMTALATEDKGKMRWLLVLGKPAEPNASAFTLKELQDYLALYLETNHMKKELPQIKLLNQLFVCSIDGRDMFHASTEPDAFAQAVLWTMKL